LINKFFARFEIGVKQVIQYPREFGLIERAESTPLTVYLNSETNPISNSELGQSRKLGGHRMGECL